MTKSKLVSIIGFTKKPNDRLSYVLIPLEEVRNNKRVELCLNFCDGYLRLGVKDKSSTEDLVTGVGVPWATNLITHTYSIYDSIHVLTVKECVKLALDECNRLFDNDGKFIYYDKEKCKEFNNMLSNSKYDDSSIAHAEVDYLYNRQEDVDNTFANLTVFVDTIIGMQLGIIPELREVSFDDSMDLNSEEFHNNMLKLRKILKNYLPIANDEMTAIDFIVNKKKTENMKLF